MVLLRKAGKIKVFVITENFPSINQPWIDTYLERLINNNISVKIYTNNEKPVVYSKKKAIYLNLISCIVDFQLSTHRRWVSFLYQVISRPIFAIKKAGRVVKFTRHLVNAYDLSLVPSFVKLFLFSSYNRELNDVMLVHSHGESLAFEFMFFALMHNIPLVYTFHGLTPKGVNPLSMAKRKALYGEATRVFVNTEFSKKQVVNIGCPKEKITILPQGLPVEDFSFSPLSSPQSDQKLYMLTVGRFHRDKGYGYSIIAAARLKKSGVNFHYYIAGVGPQKVWMMNLINRLEVADVVTVHEALPTDAIHELYQKVHLFILPSVDNRHGEHVETQGVVLQEAQASGCIPIATRVGGIPECINHKVDGLLIKDRSHRAIVDAIMYMLDNPQLWEKYQLAGRRNVEENFSADIIGKRMAALLKEMAQK